MHLCPRYITPCHPNSGVDKSAPPLHRQRTCSSSKRTKQAQWHCWSTESKFSSNSSQPNGPVALLVRCQFPNQAGHGGAVGQGFGNASFHLTSSRPIGHAGTVGQGLLLSPFSQPSGPKRRCWSGFLCPLGLPNQTGQGGAVGQDFFGDDARFLLVSSQPIGHTGAVGQDFFSNSRAEWLC